MYARDAKDATASPTGAGKLLPTSVEDMALADRAISCAALEALGCHEGWPSVECLPERGNRTRSELAGRLRGSTRLLTGMPLPFLPCRKKLWLQSAARFGSGLYLQETRRFRPMHHLPASLKAASKFQVMPGGM